MDKIKILVAEDEDLIRKIYENGLHEDVFERRIVSDGGEAMEVYLAWNPDIIVLDVRMPIMTGYSVLKEIREKKEDNSTTIIMATALSEKSDVIAFAKLGIQGYITKPIKVGEIGRGILEYYKKVKPEEAKVAMDKLKEARERERELKWEKAKEAQKDQDEAEGKEAEEKTVEDKPQKENSPNRKEED